MFENAQKLRRTPFLPIRNLSVAQFNDARDPVATQDCVHAEERARAAAMRAAHENCRRATPRKEKATPQSPGPTQRHTPQRKAHPARCDAADYSGRGGACPLTTDFPLGPLCFLLQWPKGISWRGNALVQILFQERPKTAQPLILGHMCQLVNDQSP